MFLSFLFIYIKKNYSYFIQYTLNQKREGVRERNKEEESGPGLKILFSC